MASTTDIKNGLVIKFNNGLCQVVEFQHVKPGKGAAFVRTKLKNITTGKVLDNTFPSGAKIEKARVETRRHQFLYKDDLGFHFMNTDTYEQVSIQESLISAPDLLKDGENLLVVVLYISAADSCAPNNLSFLALLESSNTSPLSHCFAAPLVAL